MTKTTKIKPLPPKYPDKYIRVWDAGYGELMWILHGASRTDVFEPQPGIPHTGKFRRYSDRGCVLASLMLEENETRNYNPPQYLIPLDIYLIMCWWDNIK